MPASGEGGVPGDRVARRLVYHVGGFDPLPPETVHRRFVRELRRFEATWSVDAHADDCTVGQDLAGWNVGASGPNWSVASEVRLVRWDDVMADASTRPDWRRWVLGWHAFLGFALHGALWGYARTAWRYACFFLYPFLLFAALVAGAVAIGLVAARLTGAMPAGIVVGALALPVLLRWPGVRLRLPHLFDDWIFSHDYVRADDPVLGPRLDRVADALVAGIRAGDVDEVVVIGHSLGAVLAVDLLDRAFRLDPAMARSATRVVLVTVGSSILKIGLDRRAIRLRAALTRVAAAPGLFWVEYQVLLDAMNFYKTQPLAVLKLPVRDLPLVRVVRISRMLELRYYRSIKHNFFRVHNQFVSGNDQRAPYDYFMLVCGPVPVERQARNLSGAVDALDDDGSLLDPVRVQHPPGIPPARTVA